MIIRTKKYKLPISTYIRLGLTNIIQEQWWISLITLGVMSGTFFIKTYWFIIGGIMVLVVYVGFWIIQFYGITQLDKNQLIFEKLTYQISSQQIIAQINTKQGMPIDWGQIIKAKAGKDYFLLFISKVHIIQLPHRIFNSAHEIRFVETVLQRKGLLK